MAGYTPARVAVLGQGLPFAAARRVRADQVSAVDVYVDGLVGHRSDKVALGSRHTGVGARECLARANRADRALVHRSGVDAAHDDLEALRLQLADRGIDGRWAGLLCKDAICYVGSVVVGSRGRRVLSTDPRFRCIRCSSCGFCCLRRRNIQAEEPVGSGSVIVWLTARPLALAAVCLLPNYPVASRLGDSVTRRR
jgi:hypothetical protein